MTLKSDVKSDLEKAMWGECPEIRSILQKSSTLDEARNDLYRFLSQLEWEHLQSEEMHPLERAKSLEAIRVLKNIISPKSEKLAGFSTLEYLWKLAKGQTVPEITEAFLQEFLHLFKAIMGKANYHKGWLGPILEREGVIAVDFSKIKGRAAGVARSNYLDKLWEKVKSYINRYPTGLDPKIIEKRKKNVQKILDYFGATWDDWYNYHWQFAHVLRGKEGIEHLKNLVPVTEEELQAVELAVENDVPWGITPYYLSLFDFEKADRSEDYQVRSQVMPPMHYVKRMIEHRSDREYYFDFMGEHDTSPIDLVTRRYAAIAIVKPYDACPQVCVYCQRNWEITGPLAPNAMIPQDMLDKALDWFEQHPSMIDVLVTGGDPFVLGNHRIEHIMNRLASMDHVKTIRWGSRIPVTVPMRINKELAELLGSYIEPGRRNVFVVTHVESAYEVTPDMGKAVMNLRKQGIYVYNQQVYTIETSRRFETCALRIALKTIGIDPYYNFYTKGKEEHKDYLIPVARIAQERKEEARLLPGIYRTEEPVFNVPRMGKNHIRAVLDREIVGITPKGERVYLWHPWEKGITPTKPWVYRDIPILRYLQEIERRGEDIKEYETIWYYY